MATGILAAGLELTGHGPAFRVALGLTAALWLALAWVLTRRLLVDRDRVRHEATTPCALTAVAATALLGSGLSLLGRQSLATGALLLAAALWPPLLARVMRHRTRRMPGTTFLVCVATQSLVVLAGALAVARNWPWLYWPALVCFCLGLLLYADALAHFEAAQLRTGAGDHWIAAGALSICALAALRLAAASAPHGPSARALPPHGVLIPVAAFLLAAGVAGCAVLLLAEVRWPRPRYDDRRWATVFPLGMTAVACLTAAATLRTPGAEVTGRVLLWVAVAAWLLTAAGLVRDRVRRRGAEEPGSPAAP
jgi:hypothetical protein